MKIEYYGLAEKLKYINQKERDLFRLVGVEKQLQKKFVKDPKNTVIKLAYENARSETTQRQIEYCNFRLM